MLRFATRLVAALLIVASYDAFCQTFDNSAKSALHGAYFVREVMLSNINVIGAPGTSQSAIGTVTFDGQGNYSFSGQIMTAGAVSPTTVSAMTGTYKCSANHLLKMQGLFPNTAGSGNAADLNAEYGGVGSIGPGAFLASATEGQNYDLLIGIPIASNSNNLVGGYTAAYLGIPQGKVSAVRSASFLLNADGQGRFGNVSVTGSAANLGNSSITQTNSGVTYTFAGNGTGSINFGAASLSQIIGGNQMFAISADGNIVLGGSPNDFDIFIALKLPATPAGNNAYLGTYFLAGVWDSVASSNSPNLVAGVYGSTTATALGVSLSHWRFNQSTPGAPSSPYDYTFAASFSNGQGGFTVGANGQAALFTSGQGFYQLIVEFQAPALSGSGVFLDPAGVVNAASYSPLTTPIAPFEIVSLYGSGLATGTASASGYPLPSRLGGTQVLMNGQAAPLFYVSPSHIVAVVPGAIQPQLDQPDNGQWTKVQVVNNGTPSNATTARVAQTSPGIFTAAQDGIGEGAIRHADFSLVSSSSPAVAGETVLIYLTGLGLVNPASIDGAAAPATPLTNVNAAVYADIDGSIVTPSFAGLAPGFAGLYQLNVPIPSTTHTGDVSLTVLIPGVSVAASATISVKAP